MGIHTPGPWAVSKTASRRVTANGVIICNAVLRNSGSAKRGIRHGAKEMVEAEANADLIAAAPEVTASLQEMVDLYVQLANCGDCGNWDPELEAQVIRARAALAKARGAA